MKIFVTASNRRVQPFDDPIGDHLPDGWVAPEIGRKVLVRHLLNHTSGLGDYPGKWRFNLAMVGRVIRHGSAYFEPEELIEVAGKKALFSPGRGFAYSDVGYLVLGRLNPDYFLGGEMQVNLENAKKIMKKSKM